MKKLVLLCFLLMGLCSCGTLKVSPQGCRTSGFWGNVPEKLDEVESRYTGEYYVFTTDKEIKLRDFLKEKGTTCEGIKKMRVQMNSVFFVKRIVNVFIIK